MLVSDICLGSSLLSLGGSSKSRSTQSLALQQIRFDQCCNRSMFRIRPFGHDPYFIRRQCITDADLLGKFRSPQLSSSHHVPIRAMKHSLVFVLEASAHCDSVCAGAALSKPPLGSMVRVATNALPVGVATPRAARLARTVGRGAPSVRPLCHVVCRSFDPSHRQGTATTKPYPGRVGVLPADVAPPAGG